MFSSFFKFSFMYFFFVLNFIFSNKNLKKKKIFNYFFNTPSIQIQKNQNTAIINSFMSFNFFYFQNTKIINDNNKAFLNNKFNISFMGKNTNLYLFNPKYILLQIKIFIEILYYLFENKKKFLIFNHPRFQLDTNIIYSLMFDLIFLNKLNLLVNNKFEKLKFKIWKLSFIKLIKKNNIDFIIFLDYEFYKFTLSFLQNLNLPIISLVNLNVNSNFFDYFIFCDTKKFINNQLILLLIFKTLLNNMHNKKVKLFFNFFYFNNQFLKNF